MAPPPGTMRVSRYFTALGLILGLLYLIVLLPGNANTPKLGIDLVGGVRVIFTAQPTAGGQVTGTAMEQARQIIEDRINGSGVTTSTVQIQGDDQLVVSIPGGTDTDVAALGQAAQLNFRPVIAPAVPTGCKPLQGTNGSTPTSTSTGASSATPSGTTSSGSTPSGSGSPSASASSTGLPRATSAPSSGASGNASGNAFRERQLAVATTPAKTPTTAATARTALATGSAGRTASGSASAPASAAPSASPTATQPTQPCLRDPFSVLTKVDKTLTIPTTEAAFSKLTQTQQQGVAQALASFNCATANQQPDRRSSYYVACETVGKQTLAYLLGKVILRGTQVDEANAIAPSTGGQGGGSTEWTVALDLDGSGQQIWGNWTKANNIGSTTSNAGSATACGTAAAAQGGTGTPCSDYVAFTLDGKVISAPVTQGPIVGKTTQVSGNFTQTTATELADQLKFGALPLSFRTDSNERVSASLGTSQLQAALLAGGIGLVLVVVYSLLYYRGLGLVTIASLIVSGLLTYALMVILGQQIGFTLDLAGIAGLIVALGITADSFVVFFERIKDEVHEGRSVRVAVPRGWVRARRTVISADVVSFLAALILYIFASADVKGFAFTLGLSTILDLFVVVVFTHPIVSLLSRSRAFGSPRFTGLNSVRAGGITPDADAPRGKRVTRPSQGTAAERAAARRGTTLVKDRDDTASPDETASDVVTADETSSDETTAGPPAGETTAGPPAGGTAAERAAARRERLRRQRDEKGE